jgi:hypothetical protein
MKPTIGQRVLAAVIAHRVGIASDRALKLYVQGIEIDPSWEMLGQALLHGETGAGVPENLSAAFGPQIVPSKAEDSPA